jgi:hypothetical protein
MKKSSHLIEFCKEKQCYYQDWADWFTLQGNYNRANDMLKTCETCVIKRYNDWLTEKGYIK